MAGGWLAIVRGFAGMQVLEGLMSFSPTIPQKWNSYTFKINFRERTLQLCINKRNIEVKLIKGQSLKIKVYEKEYILEENNPAIISTIIKNQ